jgi:hypothetical protein
MQAHPVFDCVAVFDALDAARQERGLEWYPLAAELWGQSSELNADRPEDHPMCGGALQRLPARGTTSCQYALILLRYLGRPPEDFLTGPVVDVGSGALPSVGPDRRIRWDLAQLHTAVNEQRVDRGLTWAALGLELGCSPGRLTNLKTARLADMDLVMRITQWLGRPASAFIHPADW